MSQNQITVVGNVVDSPVRRRAGSGEVTKFRLAGTERRYDTAGGQWVDGDTFYVDVDSWNALGANVASCVVKGDPVLVTGRIATSEYEVDGGRRSRPVITAQAVGHDLSRGSAVFKRTPRAAPGTDPAGTTGERPPGDLDYVHTEDQQSPDPLAAELTPAGPAPF